MSKFKKKTNTSQDIPTSALPDIIFMLLFFFMVTTVLREQDILVEQNLPKAAQLKKLEKKSLVKHIYIGRPKKTEQFGTEARIQLNDAFAVPEDIVRFVQQEKDKLSEAEKDQLTISLKSDDEAKMGLISDVQFQLREVNARKVMYSTPKKVDDI
jgi:biopolymer transport protein ExbD